jgi:hypothetical protein
MAASAYYNQVQNLYVAYFGRPADKLGLEYYANLLDKSNGNQLAMLHDFAASTESVALYNQSTTSGKINAMYQSLFGRAADIDGLAYWVNQVQTGKVIMSEVAATIAYGAQTADAAIVAAKLTAAATFTAGITTVEELLAYENNVAIGRTWLTGVTSAATATTAAATVDSTLAGAVAGGSVTPGSTFTLTTGVDLPSSTGGNDTYIADNTGGTKQLAVADQLNGGAGTDTLKVYLADGDTATGQPTLTSIENLHINGGAITAYTAATGTTGLTIENAVALTNATYTLSGQAVTLSKALTASAATAMVTTLANAATTTAATVTLSGYTSSGDDTHTLAVTGTTLATLNLVSTGASNKVTSLTNASAALTTLNISGDKNLSLTEALAGVKTINASTATGNVTLDVSGATKPITFAFTGGSGNDTLTVAAGQLATTALTSGAQLDFGTGTDTLVIKDTTPVYTAINAVKGLDVVQLGVTGGTFNMAQLTPTQVAFSSVADGTVSNLDSTDSVIVKGAMSGALTVGGAVGNSTGTIALGTSTTAGFTVASLVTTGLTNITLSSNGTNAAANIVTAITNSDNSNFTITGSNDLTMAVTAGATVTGDKVNAAAFTGKLNVTGSDLADIIIGGSGIDTITAGKGADVLTGGAGVDTFVFVAGVGATNSGATFGLFDEITDFVIGTDKLQFTTVTDVVSGQQAAVQTAVTALAAGSTALQIATAMAAANTTNLGVSFAVYNGSTYVLYETTGADADGAVADDVFIKLTGVTTLPTFAADVIA